MQGRRLKYLDPISSPCEGIGELKYRPQKSTFNASDRELLFRTWVTGGIEKKHVCDIHHCFLMRSVIQKENVVDENFPTRVIGGIEKVC